MEYIPRNCDSFKIDFYEMEPFPPLPSLLFIRFIQLSAREPMIRATLLHSLLYARRIGGRDFRPTRGGKRRVLLEPRSLSCSVPFEFELFRPINLA